MMMILQVGEIVESVEKVSKINNSTVEGLLLAMCIVLGLIAFFVFKYFNKELRRQEEMYRDEIKGLQDTLRHVIESKIKILKQHPNDIEKVTELFRDTIKDFKEAVRDTKRTG